jgi:CheY-like chemotaxis protein
MLSGPVPYITVQAADRSGWIGRSFAKRGRRPRFFLVVIPLLPMKLTRKNLRILLVDDDDNDAELLRIALAEAGFTYPLTHFRNGAIALEYFKYTKATGSQAPNIILLDLNMPLIDGVGALHRLRQLLPFRNVPVIVLTGSDDAEKRREVAQLGIFRYLTKEPNCTNAIAALDDFIEFSNRSDDLIPPNRNVSFVVQNKKSQALSKHARIKLF